MKQLILAASFVLIVLTATAQRSMWWGATKRPGAPTSFSPSDISGLVHWYDAQSIVGKNNGDEVTTWTNKVGGSTNYVGQTGTSPTYISSDSKFGNKASLMFDSGARMTGSNVTSTARTIFIVCTCTNTAYVESYYLIDGGNVVYLYSRLTGWGLRYEAPATWLDGGDGTGHPINSTAAIGVLRYSDLSTLDTRMNSGAWTTIDPNDGYPNQSEMSMGFSGNATIWIAEVLMYSSALSDSDVNRVGNYLASRWGFTWTNL